MLIIYLNLSMAEHLEKYFQVQTDLNFQNIQNVLDILFSQDCIVHGDNIFCCVFSQMSFYLTINNNE